MEDIEELFKSISKSFQGLIQDLSREEVDHMMDTLKKEKGLKEFLFHFLYFITQLLHSIMIQCYSS